MSSKKGVNMTSVKYQNRSLILNILRQFGPIPRVDIAQRLSLTPAAITILVNEMVLEGIVNELGQLEEDNKLGRRKMLIDINYDHKYVIGISIEQEWINIGVSNLRGEVKISSRFRTDRTVAPAQLLNTISSSCVSMLWKESILKENVLGIGVGIIGQVDREGGISLHAYGLWNEKVPVKEILEKELQLPVIVDNNVRALALGEMESRKGDEASKTAAASNMLFVKYGPGVGSALIINNEIYYGSSNAAGEMGHTIVEYQGEQCKCGRNGCLETIASEKAVIRKLAVQFSPEKTPMLHELCEGNIEAISSELIYKAAADGDTYVSEALKNAAYYMSLAVANSVTIFDPEIVVLYGSVFKQEQVIDEFTEVLKNTLCRSDVSSFIALSNLNPRESHAGGIAIALREFFYDIGGM